ncbi:MAG: hypothetical protein EA402_10700 [Planctomycetota bacterium]|nr:MAG: hypothetical protein EA402_10700 [Planctomycetota bacterium]
MALPAPASLTSHQPPALLLAELLEAAADGSQALSQLQGAPTDLLTWCEAGAQTVAVLLGYGQSQAAGAGGEAGLAKGMLVGLKGAEILIPGAAAHRCRVARILDLPPFAVYAAEFLDHDGRLIGRSEIKTMGMSDSPGGNP